MSKLEETLGEKLGEDLGENLAPPAGAAGASPVAQWLMDEGSGNDLFDNAGSVDLDVTSYLGTGGAWSSDGAGTGLSGDGSGNPIVDGGLGEFSWENETKLVYEAYLNDGTTANVTYFVALKADGSRAFAVFRAISLDIFGVNFGAGGSGNQRDYADFISGAGAGVLHVVVDTAQATAADRVKVYWNGVLQTATGGELPAQDSAVATWGAANAIELLDDFSTFCGYSALYFADFDPDTDVSANSTALTSNHDADPNA